MGRFYKALQRRDFESESDDGVLKSNIRRMVGLAPVQPSAALRMPHELAREPTLNRLTEQLSALSVPQGRVCVLVTGCSAGDGTSAIAAAIAFDMSQRLGLSTILVDGHVRHPTLHDLLLRSEPVNRDASLRAPARIQPTGMPRLDLAIAIGAESVRDLTVDFESLIEGYSAAVVDLGVVRLDPAALAFARTENPVLLVVRRGHTNRSDLATTISVLKAARLSPSGVIFNGTQRQSLSKTIGRIFGIGG